MSDQGQANVSGGEIHGDVIGIKHEHHYAESAKPDPIAQAQAKFNELPLKQVPDVAPSSRLRHTCRPPIKLL